MIIMMMIVITTIIASTHFFIQKKTLYYYFYKCFNLKSYFIPSVVFYKNYQKEIRDVEKGILK